MVFRMGDLLVAVDGSKYSDKIVAYSCNLAKDLSKKILLIYVSKYPELIEEYIGFGGKSPVKEARRYVAVAEALTSKLAKKVRDAGVPYEIILDTGNPSEQIIAKATEKKVDIIVVGLRGLHGLGRIRSLGSVARRVLENSPYPVVVIPA